ncbi:hypothetical protein N0V88_006254 [Collariella sp. IMI 366227]|nr:hypothetical protein N0V88_006254 [Collariella sp. IMI 366227]
MQFKTLITALAVAMTASAMPAGSADAVEARTEPSVCNNNQKSVCCNGLLGLLGCTVGILGGNCNGEAYCCQTNAPLGSLINVQLLNCLHL